MTKPATSKPRNAVLYARVSLDPSGEGAAVDRQLADARALAAQRGWRVVDEHTDNSVSAAGKRQRPAFDAALTDVAEGRADVIVAWALDRLTRNARDQLRLVETCRDRSATVALVRGSDLDMSTPAGRLTANLLGDVAQHEIDQKGDRQRRALRQRADKGRPPLGVRLTGYTTKGEIIDDEAAFVREVFDRFASGESLRGLVRWATDQGHVTRRGRPWSPSTFATMLRNPRYAGRVRYCGDVVAEGAWEPIVSPETFAVVQHILDDPRRRTQQSTDRKYLGSGLYLCSACDEPTPMRGWSGRRYRCANGHHSRSGTEVDPYVVRHIEARLSQPDVAALLAVPNDERAEKLHAAASRLRERLAATEADYDADLIDGRRYRTKRDKITSELAVVDRERAALLAGRGPAAVLAAPDPVAAFRQASLMIRREVVAFLVDVTLYPAPRGSRTFDPSTVDVTFRTH